MKKLIAAIALSVMMALPAMAGGQSTWSVVPGTAVNYTAWAVGNNFHPATGDLSAVQVSASVAPVLHEDFEGSAMNFVIQDVDFGPVTGHLNGHLQANTTGYNWGLSGVSVNNTPCNLLALTGPGSDIPVSYALKVGSNAPAAPIGAPTGSATALWWAPSVWGAGGPAQAVDLQITVTPGPNQAAGSYNLDPVMTFSPIE